jgi:CheY-like chemotaxis protein
MSEPSEGVILLGEDDWAQLDVLIEVLGSEGYRVLPATNPSEVVKELNAGPDLVLLDVRGVSSPEVITAIQTSQPRPALVVVSADVHVADFAKEVGADAYVRKPYELEELLSTVAKLLRLRRRDIRAS